MQESCNTVRVSLMADKEFKYSDNVNGAFYVDTLCIACDACVQEAPSFFKMNDCEGYAFVFFQPQSYQEINQCQKALELCPVGAIGEDG